MRSGKNETREGRNRQWEPMSLSYEGHAREVIKGGGGKNTPAPSDPGESRKPKPKEGGT